MKCSPNCFEHSLTRWCWYAVVKEGICTFFIRSYLFIWAVFLNGYTHNAFLFFLWCFPANIPPLNIPACCHRHSTRTPILSSDSLAPPLLVCLCLFVLLRHIELKCCRCFGEDSEGVHGREACRRRHTFSVRLWIWHWYVVINAVL